MGFEDLWLTTDYIPQGTQCCAVCCSYPSALQSSLSLSQKVVGGVQEAVLRGTDRVGSPSGTGCWRKRVEERPQACVCVWTERGRTASAVQTRSVFLSNSPRYIWTKKARRPQTHAVHYITLTLRPVSSVSQTPVSCFFVSD